jgi:hypothetical protein
MEAMRVLCRRLTLLVHVRLWLDRSFPCPEELPFLIPASRDHVQRRNLCCYALPSPSRYPEAKLLIAQLICELHRDDELI